VLTLWKLQARTAHSTLPSLLQMKHGTYSMNRKQKDEAQYGGAQTHLPQISCTAFKNKNNVDSFFQVQRCSA